MAHLKLTPERQQRICVLIEAGHFNTVAARSAGVCEKTFYLWMEKGERSHEEYRKVYGDFKKAVDQATANSEDNLLKDVRRGGARMALELLKRRFPERWGDRQRLEHTTRDGETLNINHSGSIKGQQPASVQIILNPADVWSDEDQERAETANASNSEATRKDENAVNMPSVTDD